VPQGCAPLRTGELQVYAQDRMVCTRFGRWRMCLMRRILEQGGAAVLEPEEVAQHTRRLLDKDDTFN